MNINARPVIRTELHTSDSQPESMPMQNTPIHQTDVESVAV